MFPHDSRVTVTGMGLTTPVGADVASTWNAVLAGRSGVRTLTDDWADGLPVRIAAPAAVDPATVLPRRECRRLDRSQQLALLAVREAWQDAGAPAVPPERLAVAFGAGCGGVLTMINSYDILRTEGVRKISPWAMTMALGNGPAMVAALELRARAAVHTPVSACASGAEAVAAGLGMLRTGTADVVVVGGVEAPIHPLPLAGFAAMRALSVRNDDPQGASRPFDRTRDGFVLGEGAGALVLERAGHAQARGARVYAELAGAGLSADAYHRTVPDPEARQSATAVRRALSDASLEPADVRHLNAHATGTPLGDVAEARAVRAALGRATDDVAVSAVKSMTGHLLGGAGAVEAVLTVLALADRLAPPTVNLDDPDDDIELDVVRKEARVLPGGCIGALSNSFGFGGHNVTLAFRSYP